MHVTVLEVHRGGTGVTGLGNVCTSVLLSSASLRHLDRMSPTAGPPSTLTISAVLPPSSDTGNTCATLVVKLRRVPAPKRFGCRQQDLGTAHCILVGMTDRRLALTLLNGCFQALCTATACGGAFVWCNMIWLYARQQAPIAWANSA